MSPAAATPASHVLECRHFEAHRCRSCTWLGRTYGDQLAAKQADTEAALGDHQSLVWEPPVPSAPAAFRNKAKMVVAGTVDAPTLGILDPRGGGVDLRDCGLHTPGVVSALPVLAELVVRARFAPYDVPTRRGELKHLLVTESPDGGLMVRFVVRSTEPLARLRSHLPWLHERLPALVVASLNVQPEHKAVLEGEREIALTEATTLPMRVGEHVLHLGPQAFFQTNTAVATALYRQAAAWTDDVAPRRVLDLYCGVGGFAVHLAAPGRRVRGVEVSEAAVGSARRTAADGGLDDVRFEVGDATVVRLDGDAAPDLVVVNPPRRGLGAGLAARLEGSGVGHVVYSSCDVGSLARDLAAMPSLVPRRGRVLDMFPQTAHREVLVLLERLSRA